MRFLADGPAIPDELLVARDEGRLIFFCGAGVSRARAGLSDFFGLARQVIEELGVVSDSPVRQVIEAAQQISSMGMTDLISADRVFALLEREFLVTDIQAAVAKALKPSSTTDLSAHRLVLDLARWPDGKVRLVTTISIVFLNRAIAVFAPRNRPPCLLRSSMRTLTVSFISTGELMVTIQVRMEVISFCPAQNLVEPMSRTLGQLNLYARF
jgi:hypothetical protein